LEILQWALENGCPCVMDSNMHWYAKRKPEVAAILKQFPVDEVWKKKKKQKEKKRTSKNKKPGKKEKKTHK